MRLSNTAAKLIFTGTALVLLTVSYILYQQVRSLINTQEQVNEKYLVRTKLEETLSLMNEAESVQRGFLLTKDSSFLQPYEAAHTRTKELLNETRSYLSDTPQDDLNALQTFVELRFNTFRQAIEHYNTPGISAETQKGHLLRSQSLMDSINKYAASIEQREEQLVRQRENDKRKYLSLTPFYAILVIAIAIGIMLFSYIKIIEHLNRSKGLLRRLKKLNNRLKAKNHKLELYNKELDSFTYIASHDLKEPLRKILTFTTLIEADTDSHLSETGKAHFSRVSHAAYRMKNLLDDLLLYSKMNLNQKDLFEEVDLDKILEDVITDLSEELKESHALIHTGELSVVRGLPFQLKQLFENLIVNAIKYSRKDITPDICINTMLVDKNDIKEAFPKTSPTYCKVMIRDNGEGFEQCYSEKIFQLFQRLQNRKDGGTGIGLTICKKIIDNHRGFIKAISEVNKGTTFEIYLPVV